MEYHRKSIRLKNYYYSQSGAYFITICTLQRECLFGDIFEGKMKLSPGGEIAIRYWLEIPKRFDNVRLDESVIMPNHIHGIILIFNVGAIHELPLQNNLVIRRKMLIPKILGYYKMNSAKQINILSGTPGIPFWQRNYYEHIIRNENELNKIREYIINNPSKWELDFENPRRTREYKDFTDYLKYVGGNS